MALFCLSVRTVFEEPIFESTRNPYLPYRYAALSDGSKCQCFSSLPLESLSPRPDSSCSIQCGASATERCGGPGGLMSVWVGTCPAGKDRFGDSCYQAASTVKSLEENYDYCWKKVLEVLSRTKVFNALTYS